MNTQEHYLNLEYVPKITALLGICFMLAELFGLVYGGEFTFIINPIMGLIGVVLSIYKKQWLFLILNIIVIVGIFIIIPIAYLVEFL